MKTTFQVLPPYVIREPDGTVSGILPELIRRMTTSCCVTCSGTVLNFDQDGPGRVSEKDTYPELLKSLDKATTFAFPIVGYPNTDTYGSQFGFIPGVEAPGMVIIVKKKSTENLALAVFNSVFGIWPVLLINVVLALVAGIIIWILVCSVLR